LTGHGLSNLLSCGSPLDLILRISATAVKETVMADGVRYLQELRTKKVRFIIKEDPNAGKAGAQGGGNLK
jgi:hypothetical protein